MSDSITWDFQTDSLIYQLYIPARLEFCVYIYTFTIEDHVASMYHALQKSYFFIKEKNRWHVRGVYDYAKILIWKQITTTDFVEHRCYVVE